MSAGRPGRSTRRANPASGFTYSLRSGRPRKTKSSDSKMQQACVASLFIQAASRALTTNHPTVTGVRPDSTGSSRASSIIGTSHRSGARCASEHRRRRRPRSALRPALRPRATQSDGCCRSNPDAQTAGRTRTVSSDAQCAGTAESYERAYSRRRRGRTSDRAKLAPGRAVVEVRRRLLSNRQAWLLKWSTQVGKRRPRSEARTRPSVSSCVGTDGFSLARHPPRAGNRCWSLV
jgi:hypothetical protein